MSNNEIRSKIRWGIAGILALLVASSIFILPSKFNTAVDAVNDTIHLGLPRVPEAGFRLGLDLRGGAHLVYQADVSRVVNSERGVAVEGVRDVVERRVNGMGLGEPSVQTTQVDDEYRLIVELPGVDDVNQAIGMIGETPILEFKVQNTELPRELTTEERQQMEEHNVDARARAQEALERVHGDEDFATVARDMSEDIQTKNNGGSMGYLASQSPYPELYEWARDVEAGEVSEDIVDSVEGYNVLKRGEVHDGATEVDASHILICFLGAQGCDNPQYTKEEAQQKAKELFDQANEENFEQLARDNSTDPSVELNGGDLGWFTKDMMVPAFAEAVFATESGQIIGPIQTDFGYHVIYKKDQRQSQEYDVFRILLKKQTESDILPANDAWKNTELSGEHLERSEVVTNPQTGEVQVALNLNAEGKELFAQITEEQLGEPVAIFLDGEIISAPTVQSVISDGRAVISGGFGIQEARLLSQRLNAGALPVPIELISQQSIGATLGAKSLQQSLFAGIVGVLVVMLFMALYYRLPGILAVVALSVYIAFTLAIFKLIGVTLTLAGIAGFILSIGMAVDANVLIFERLKEELRDGKSLKAAVEEGFKRAWTSIRDGNISTLITCVLLMWFGTSFVKGFAVTLGIGVLLSMFSAITITRVMLRFVVPWFKTRDGGVAFRGTPSHTSTSSK